MKLENKKISDTEMAEKTSDALDDLGAALKKSSRKIFDVLVERTVDTMSDLFDTKLKQAKKKLKKE